MPSIQASATLVIKLSPMSEDEGLLCKQDKQLVGTPNLLPFKVEDQVKIPIQDGIVNVEKPNNWLD